MMVSDIETMTFGNGRQIIDRSGKDVRLMVKSGIQDIKGMNPEKEYPCYLIEKKQRNYCRFLVKQSKHQDIKIKKFRDIEIIKLHFVRQIK